MDAFLNKITGKDHPDAAHQPQVHSDSHPPPVVTEATTQTVPKKEEDHGFNFSAIKDALTGGSSSTVKQPPVPPPVAVTTNTHSEPSRDKDAWHEKFRDLLDRGVSNKPDAEAEKLRLEREAVEKEVAAREAEEKASVKGKLKGIFKSDEEEAAEHNRLVEEAIRKRREAEIAKKNEHTFSARIKDVFDDDDEEKERERVRLAEEAKRNQSFGARVRNIFDRPDTPPPQPKGWKDKLNELAGGGAKAETKEGHLDKAIDFYQEHVLHAGDQKHESALEQAKDARIASAIRHTVGLKKDEDKEHHH